MATATTTSDNKGYKRVEMDISLPLGANRVQMGENGYVADA
jgi:hypothetical protein